MRYVDAVARSLVVHSFQQRLVQLGDCVQIAHQSPGVQQSHTLPALQRSDRIKEVIDDPAATSKNWSQ